MSEFTPLAAQDAAKLPQVPEPLWQKHFGPDFSNERFAELRRTLVEKLGDTAVQACVGMPIPEERIADITLALDEVAGNAHRPEANPPRHLTSVTLWGGKGHLELAVGDDSDTIAAADGRETSETLDLDTDADPLANFDEENLDAFLAEQGVNGRGNSILEHVTDGVSYSLVPPEKAVHIEGRPYDTHKIVVMHYELGHNQVDQAA